MENKDLRNVTSEFQWTGRPRTVPLLIRLRILFGGFLNQFGWLFFGFGMIFVWLFTLQADLTSWFVFRGTLETAQGSITTSRKTNVSVGGSKHSKGTPVYEHQYSFTWGNDLYEGTSYCTGGGTLEAEKNVLIEFPRGHPKTSRIRGMRRGIVGLFGLMPVIFPAIGLVFISHGFRKGLKAIHLLAFGQLAEGKLISKEPTNTRVNKKTVYKLTFEFAASDGQTHQAIARTHETKDLEDEQAELLLYDPMRPAYAVMLDDLPGRPRFGEAGTITTGSPAGAFTCLLIPAMSVIGHGTWLYLKLFS